MIHTTLSFTTSRKDLKDIYVTFVRSILDNSSVVWHSSLTKNNSRALEIIQKIAVRIIMGSQYQTYKKSLKTLNIDNSETRREKLCLSFAKKCLQHEKWKHWCPLSKARNIKTRNTEKYKFSKALTKSYKNSAIPYMKTLLNNDHSEKLNLQMMVCCCCYFCSVNFKY